MALFYPDILEHNNPNNPLMDITQLKGICNIDLLVERDTIPVNKRSVLYTVNCRETEKGYIYKGTTTDDIDWLDSNNWKVSGYDVIGVYLPLTGGTLTGTLNVPILSATTIYGDGTNLTNVDGETYTKLSLGSGVISTTMDLLETDISDNTKLSVKNEFKILFTDFSDTSNPLYTILDVPVQTGITLNAPTGVTSFVGVRNNGGSPEFFIKTNSRDFNPSTEIFLGWVFTKNISTEFFMSNQPYLIQDSHNQFKSFISNTKTVSVISGADITPISGQLKYIRESGVYWSYMSNNDITDPSKVNELSNSPTELYVYNQTGDYTLLNAIDPTTYDLNGVTTTVPDNNWTLIYIAHWPSTDGNLYEGYQRGDRLFNSLDSLLSNLSMPALMNSEVNSIAVITHIIAIKKECTDLTDENTCKIIIIDDYKMYPTSDIELNVMQQTGVISWVGDDILTINSGNTSLFDISEMTIGVYDKTLTPAIKYKYIVPAQTGLDLPNIATTTRTMVYWDVINKVIIKTTGPNLEIGTPTLVKLGHLIHFDHNTISSAITHPRVFETDTIWDSYLTSSGIVKKTGYVVSDGNGDASINHTDGKFIGLSIGSSRTNFNEATIIGSSTPSITRMYLDSNGCYQLDPSVTGSTQLDTTKYDDLSGTLQVVPLNNFVNIYLVVIPIRDVETLIMIRGSSTYNTINIARQTPDFLLDVSLLPNAFIVSKISIKQGVTNITTAINELNCHIAQTDQFGTPILDPSNDIIIGNVNQSGIISFTESNLLYSASTTTFNISAMQIACIDYAIDPNNPIKYLSNISQSTGNTVTNIATYAETWVGYDYINSVIIQQVSSFTPLQSETIIQLGKISHHNHSTIDDVISLPQYSYTDRDTTVRLLSSGRSKLNGYIVSPNGANLFINHSQGDFIGLGIGEGSAVNYSVIPSENAISLIHVTRDASNKAIFAAPTTTIDVTNYESAPNVLSDVAVNRYSNIFIYTFPVRGIDKHYIIRDTKEYTSIELAKSGGLVNGVVLPVDLVGGCITAYISFAGSIITNLTSSIALGLVAITQVTGTLGGSTSATGQNMQSTYNLSDEPEIRTDAIRGAFTVQNATGNADNISNLYEGKNSSGITTSFIRGDGAISATTYYGDGQYLTGLVTNTSQITLKSYTKDETGFINPELVNISYNKTNRTVTLTGSIAALYQGQIVTALSGASWTSDAHASGQTVNQFLYYNGTSFVWSTTVWTFDTIQICAAIYMDPTIGFIGIRESHGLMQWQAHREFHNQIGTYYVSGGGTTGLVLNSTTITNRRPGTDTLTLADEDLFTTNPLILPGIYPQMWLSGTTSLPVNNFSLGNTDIISLLTNQPYYNQSTGGNWVQTLVPNDGYISVYRLDITAASDINSQAVRSIWVQGQILSIGGNAASNASALDTQLSLSPSTLNLGRFSSTEYRLGYQYVIRYTSNNWTIQGHQAIAGSRNSPVSIQGGGLTSVVHGDNLLGSGTVSDPLLLNPSITATTITATTYYGNGNNLTGLVTTPLFSGHTGDTSIHYVKSSINLSDLGSSAHTHTISNVTNLQTELNNKAYLSGATFTGPLSATTISATTYQGITSDMVTNLSSLTGDTITAVLNVSDAIEVMSLLSGDMIALARMSGETSENKMIDVDNAKTFFETDLSLLYSHTGDTSIHYVKSSINLSDLGSSAHTHTISDVIDLQTTINGKTDLTLFNSHTGQTNAHNVSFDDLITTAHTHTISDITDLNSIGTGMIFVKDATELNSALITESASVNIFVTEPITGVTFSNITPTLINIRGAKLSISSTSIPNSTIATDSKFFIDNEVYIGSTDPRISALSNTFSFYFRNLTSDYPILLSGIGGGVLNVYTDNIPVMTIESGTVNITTEYNFFEKSCVYLDGSNIPEAPQYPTGTQLLMKNPTGVELVPITTIGSAITAAYIRKDATNIGSHFSALDLSTKVIIKETGEDISTATISEILALEHEYRWDVITDGIRNIGYIDGGSFTIQLLYTIDNSTDTPIVIDLFPLQGGGVVSFHTLENLLLSTRTGSINDSISINNFLDVDSPLTVTQFGTNIGEGYIYRSTQDLSGAYIQTTQGKGLANDSTFTLQMSTVASENNLQVSCVLKGSILGGSLL